MALVAFTACDDDDDPTGNENVALVRVVNASNDPDFANVNVFDEDDNELDAAIGFRTATSCDDLIELEPGEHTLEFRLTGQMTPIETETFNFLANERYTVVLFGSNAAVDAVVFRDDEPTSVPAGQNAIRVINATEAAGDVFATTAGGAVTGDPDLENLGSGAGTTTPSTFRNFPTADVRFRLFDVGDTDPALADITLDDLPNSRRATVIFTEPVSGGIANSIQMNSC
jgi:hypothetical protein